MSDKGLLLEIQNLNEQWMHDFLKGDAVAVGSHYTEDAISLPPHTGAVVGRDAIIGYWNEAMKSGAKGLDIRSKEVESAEGTAYEVGETDLLGLDNTVIDHFHYMVIWKKHGSKWLIHREIWNSSMKK